MFSITAKKIITTAAAVALSAAMFGLSAAPASAFSIGVGFHNGDISLMTTPMRDAEGWPVADEDDEDHVGWQQRFYDQEWQMLENQDARIHIGVELNNGRTDDDLQREHDCTYVLKIKSLLAQMKTNLRHYEAVHAEHWLIESEKEDIARWTKELKKATKECSK